MKSIPLLTLALALSLTGCLLESVAPIDRSIRPYGAHWIKEGMTKESRLSDLRTCGNIGDEKIEFDPKLISAEKRPDEPNEIAAYLRLRHQLGQCMRKIGYQPIGDLRYLSGCDARCMYP